ncbi:InlB B-repeat-containing protein [Comamonas sp.]|uniref:InlB B-repeat-containing protein n=1 Tax=Comamonas sp. TaxID=34028 RepID=UPI00258B403B|nr:phage tail tube protein [Comamonas sp.]
MSGIRTSAGSSLSVTSTKPATYTEAGFKAIDAQFQKVAEITDLGEFGRQYNLVTHNPLDTRRTGKRKGSYNDGSITVPLARDTGDQGQAVMKAALLSDESYSYRITLQDGTKFYFSAQCMSFTNTVGGVDSITGHNAQLEIDNDIIEALPTTFELVYAADANGSLIGVPNQTVVMGGFGTPVAAVAASGYVFSKWSDNSVANPRTDGPVTASLSVAAQFTPE